MKYLSTKIDKPLDEVERVLHAYLADNYNAVEKINDKFICKIAEQRTTTTVKNYFFTIYIKTHQDSTCLFFVSLTDDVYNFDREFKKIIQNLEYKLGVYSHFSNLTMDYFVERKEKTLVEKKDPSIPTAKRFDEIVQKLVSLKELLRQKVITKEEFKEKSTPLIEEL